MARRRGKKKSGFFTILSTLLIIIVLAAAGGIYYASSRSDKDVAAEKPKVADSKDRTQTTVKSDTTKEQQPKTPVGKETPKQEPKTKAKLAILVDDCGYDLQLVRRLVDLKAPFSYAILPYRNFSSDALHVINGSGQTAMLHLPMEPMNSKAMSEGKTTVLTTMSSKEIRKVVRDAVESLPGIAGVNNHQGSKATSDPKTMEVVLKELKKHNLFFIDSNTYPKSIGDSLAKKMGIPTGRNKIFLDNKSDAEYVKGQIRKAVTLAKKNGSVIAICHARPQTVKAWEEILKEVKSSGVELVSVTEVLQ